VPSRKERLCQQESTHEYTIFLLHNPHAQLGLYALIRLFSLERELGKHVFHGARLNELEKQLLFLNLRVTRAVHKHSCYH
jgi:hypothetical protein